jgi:hypothetical protein
VNPRWTNSTAQAGFDVLGTQWARSLSKEQFCPIFKLFIQKSSKNFKLYGRVCLVCITVNSRGVKRRQGRVNFEDVCATTQLLLTSQHGKFSVW